MSHPELAEALPDISSQIRGSRPLSKPGASLSPSWESPCDREPRWRRWWMNPLKRLWCGRDGGGCSNLPPRTTPMIAWWILLQRQPNLSVRSSTSVLQQAYSTPIPIAYLASALAGIDGKTTVYEPTAGNGALLIGANPTTSLLMSLTRTVIQS